MSSKIALISIFIIFYLKAIKSEVCLAVGGSTSGLYTSGIYTRSASSLCPITTTGCIYLYDDASLHGYFDMTQYAGITVQFDYKITTYVYGSYDYTSVSYKCGGSTATGYTIRTSANNANYNTAYRRQFNLPSSCDYSSSSIYIRIEQNSYNSWRTINIENVCLFGSVNPTVRPTYRPTVMPTVRPSFPTRNPTSRPTTEPTPKPTIGPTEQPTKAPTKVTLAPTIYVAVQYINDIRCKDLGLSYNVIYNGNYDDCVSACRPDTQCVMINYFKYFKTENDSRCYMYKKICEMMNASNNGQSIITYETNDFNCQSYPINWQDRIGDTCSHYNSHNWCVNGKPNNLNNIYTFEDKNGLTGIDVCCNCGGGIYNYDNTELVYFNEDNYKRFDNNNVYRNGLNLDRQIKSWNNLMLYDIMNSNNINESSNFDDLLFLDSNKLKNNLYLCELNNNIDYISDYFIYIKQYNNIFINKHWSNIEVSSFINLIPYLECLDKINFTLPLLGVSAVNISANTYNTDTITISNETKKKKSISYITAFIITIIVLIITFITLCVIAFWYFHKRRFNNVNNNEQPNDDRNPFMENNSTQSNITNNAGSFRMKCFFGTNQHIFVYAKEADTIAYLKMLIAHERNKNNNINCVVSSIETLDGIKLSSDNKTLQDYGINKDTATVVFKTCVAPGGNTTN